MLAGVRPVSLRFRPVRPLSLWYVNTLTCASTRALKPTRTRTRAPRRSSSFQLAVPVRIPSMSYRLVWRLKLGEWPRPSIRGNPGLAAGSSSRRALRLDSGGDAGDLLEWPPERLHDRRDVGVRRVVRQDAAGSHDQPDPARLSDRVERLRAGLLGGPVPQRLPLVEAADDGAPGLGLALGEGGRCGAIVPVPGVARQHCQTVEQEPVTVTVDDREDRLAAHRLEDATIVGLAEARVVLLGAHAPARRLDRVEDARDALGERQRGESDHRLGDRLEGARDERRVLREVVREPRARELPRERARREERGQDRRVADTPVEAHPHDGLELLDPARRRARIERADRLPVLGRTDGAAHAGPVTILPRLVALDAPPRLDRVAAARRDLEKVRAVALVEPERRLREPGGGAVDRREVAPDGVGHAVDGLAVDRRQDALAPAQLLHGSGPRVR